MKVFIVQKNPKHEGDGFPEIVLVTTDAQAAYNEEAIIDANDDDYYGDVEEHEVVS